MITKLSKYHKRGKIRWAKLPRIQPNVVFTEKLSRCLAFTTLKQHIYTKLVNVHGKTFVVLLKTAKRRKFSPANLSPFTV